MNIGNVQELFTMTENTYKFQMKIFTKETNLFQEESES